MDKGIQTVISDLVEELQRERPDKAIEQIEIALALALDKEPVRTAIKAQIAALFLKAQGGN